MKSQRPLIFIFITLLIDVTGFGIIIPVIPRLIMTLTGGTLGEASVYGGWLLFAYAFFQFIFSPILGGLSDQFGRRPVLLFALLGFGIDYLLTAWAPTIGWLFLGRIIAGITGSSFTAASAFIADVSTPEKRAQNFGLIGAAFGLGFILGPMIGGVLGEIDIKMPFYAAACLAFLNAIYGFVVLPESLAPENRRPFDIRRANPIGTLTQLKKYPVIMGLIFSLVCVYLAAHATQSTWAYFTIEKFKWSEAEVGYSLGFVGMMIALVQGVIIRPVSRKFGHVKSLFIGLSFNMIGFVLIALVPNGLLLYVVLVPYALGGIAGPSLQGIMTGEVGPNQQGELQGGLTSLISVTSIFGPLLMTSIFGYFTMPQTPYYLPSAPFYLGALLAGLSLLFAYRSLSVK